MGDILNQGYNSVAGIRDVSGNLFARRGKLSKIPQPSKTLVPIRSRSTIDHYLVHQGRGASNTPPVGSSIRHG